MIFLLDNHLQRPRATKQNYGLYYNDELVSMVNISKSRYNKNYEYELLRSCTTLNTTVIGGFNKIIKHVIADLNIKSIISYVDQRYFTGNGYSDWKELKNSIPNYFYVNLKNFKVRESRLKYQKHKLKEKENYDGNLTEWEIMQLEGYDRIWDCGNKVFVLENT